MAKIEIKFQGHFSIEFGQDNLEAYLAFSTGTDLDKPWTMLEIGDLVKSAGIINGYKADEVSKALGQAIEKKQKSFQLTIAKGTIPVLAEAETFEAGTFPVPENLKEAVRQVLDTATAPIIEKEVQVKVEVEKLVQKKGLLPFMAGKEEKVKVVEKQVRREIVAVDTTVLAYLLVEAEAKIGKIYPAKPGQPGKSIKGEIVQPKVLSESTLYLGPNLKKKSGEVVADVAGIVRIGKNWLDLIAFAAHQLGFELSEDKATLLMTFIPGSKFVQAPSYESILEKAKSLGFAPNTLVPEHEFASLIIEALESGTKLERHPVTLPEDAFFDITISDDKLKAVLNASKGSGHGKQLVLKEIGVAINESKLKLTDREKVKVDILAFFRSSERALIGYSLAEGTIPAPPPPQAITHSVELLAGKEYDKVRGQIANTVPKDLEGFPLDKLKALAFVEKEQRIVTLGTIVSGGTGIDVFGSVIPALSSSPLSIKLFGRLELNQTFIVAKIPGLLLRAEDGGNVYFAIIEHADSAFRIEIAPNAMEAWLYIESHKGSGLVIKSEAIRAEIAKVGIKKGIIEDALKDALEKASQGQDLAGVCIAKGQDAVSGGNSRLEILIASADGKPVRIRADGTADYKSLNKITSVKKDTPIARILPPDLQPINGWDVKGKEIKASAGNGKDWELGPNVRSEKQTDGSTLILANVDGELKQDKGIIDVVAVYTIKGHLDAKIGNLKFPGSIQIAGDVMAGFFVMAGGDIKINGSIEAALLSSDADILIQGGVKGHGKALLRARKGILASFAEQSTMMGIGDIKIKKTLLRCNVKCNSRLLMPDDGRIIGGDIRVKHGMQVGSIGSENAIPTKITFGQDILVEDQIQTVEKEIVKIQAEVALINTGMKHPEKIANKEIMQELFTNKVKNMKILEKHNLRLFALKEQFEQHAPSEVIITGTVYPGVVFECHGRTLEFRTAKNKLKISFDTEKGHIVESEISSTPRK